MNIKTVPLFTIDEGSGAPLLLLHGLGADHAMFERQIRRFSSHQRVIAPDLRGNGRSPALATPIEDVLATQTADVVALLDRLGIDAVHVAGVSYGGIIAQELLIQAPKRVLSATISDSFGDMTPHSWGERFNALGADQTWPLTMPKPLRRALLLPALHVAYRRWPGVAAAMGDYLMGDRAVETALQRRAINRLRNLPRLAEVLVPVQCVYGDTSTLLRRCAEDLARAIPGARAIPIPDSTDPSNLCQPERWEALVRSLTAEAHA